MASVSGRNLVDAVLSVEHMSFRDRERMQWDGRPHPKRHRCAKVEVSSNHLNREGRPP